MVDEQNKQNSENRSSIFPSRVPPGFAGERLGLPGSCSSGSLQYRKPLRRFAVVHRRKGPISGYEQDPDYTAILRNT